MWFSKILTINKSILCKQDNDDMIEEIKYFEYAQELESNHHAECTTDGANQVIDSHPGNLTDLRVSETL